MSIVARVARRVAPRPGSVRTHRFYQGLHRLALHGLGYGRVAGVATSGEGALLDRLANRPLSLLVDAGANRGEWALAALERWPAAAIHAFEPAADVCEELRGTLGDRAVVQNKALGASTGTATLHKVSGSDTLSSLHLRDLARHDMTMTDAEVVEVVTLDSYCDDAEIDHIDLLKIDVEGHELAVLNGASRMLAEDRIDVIQFEFGGTDIDARTFLRDFVDLLNPRFTISRLLTDGQVPLDYREESEIFVGCNFVAERRQ